LPFRSIIITIWKKKGGKRIRKEGKPNLWLLQLGIPQCPRQAQIKKAGRLSCFTYKKLGRNCPEPPLGPSHECSKTGVALEDGLP
jgi:hypothetical protein